MKITEIRVTISQTLAVGKYESVKPSVTLSAELEAGDDLSKCNLDLHAMASELWASNALKELSWIPGRRKDEDKHELNVTIGQTRLQIKGLMLKNNKG